MAPTFQWMYGLARAREAFLGIIRYKRAGYCCLGIEKPPQAQLPSRRLSDEISEKPTSFPTPNRLGLGWDIHC
jgi:hypothetical protein